MATEKNGANNPESDGFLEATEADMRAMSEYITDNDVNMEEIEAFHKANAERVLQDMAGFERAAEQVDPNQISFFDKEGFLQQAMGQAVEETMEKTASFMGPVNGGNLSGWSSTSQVVQRPYTSPMLTLSDFKIPKTTPEFFKWCKYYYTFDPLIAGAINALATFPVTEIYLEDSVDNKQDMEDDSESDQLKLYKRVLIKNMNLIDLCVCIGIDYCLYGNCFVFGEMKTGVDGLPEWGQLIRLDPNKILIDFNQVTQQRRYRWIVPDSVARICREKKPKEDYARIPEIVKRAVREKKSILLNSERIYHFSRPSDSVGDGGAWGVPMIAHVIKLIAYRNILRQAQEAIAREHIVPMRIYYMQSGGRDANYMQSTDWNNVADNLAKHITRSVRDPNYKVVSPYPLGLLNVGGEGKQLLLTPEIEQIQSEILAGLGVPREFIFGGVSYSGTSISLRILENQFITYRLKLLDFINNFLIRGMAKARGEWTSEKDDDALITAKMVEMKMVDDVQQKQIIVDLNRTGKVTDDLMWKTLGLDPDQIRSGLRKEALDQIENNKQIEMANIKARMEIEQYQRDLQQAYGIAPQEGEEGEQSQDGQPQAGEGESSQEGQQGVPLQADMGGQPQEGAQAVPPQGQEGEEGGQPQEGEQAPNLEQQIYAIAKKLLSMPEDQREMALQSIPEEMRQRIVEVMEVLESDNEAQDRRRVDMRPLPEQRPPRRKGYQ